MLGYLTGIYDILRINDLERIDKAIQENLERGNKYFALAIYDDKLCEKEGLSTPVKSDKDRVEIAKYLSGVDFSFLITSTDEKEILKKAEEAFNEYIIQKKKSEKLNKNNRKPYSVAYAPGTYDLFHAGHLENLLEASEKSEKLIVGVKSDELVRKHKGRIPMIDAQERMEILRHFKFVDGVYQYHTRDPHIAANWIEKKYGKKVDAIFLGSDLKNDFKNIKDLNLIFTDRDPKMTRSTTNYREKLRTLKHPEVAKEKKQFKEDKKRKEDKLKINVINEGELEL